MWLLVVLGFIWIGEHKGKIILDCIALLEEGEGKHENAGTGGKRGKEGREDGDWQRQALPGTSPPLVLYAILHPTHPVPKRQAWADPKNDSSVTLRAL